MHVEWKGKITRLHKWSHNAMAVWLWLVLATIYTLKTWYLCNTEKCVGIEVSVNDVYSLVGWLHGYLIWDPSGPPHLDYPKTLFFNVGSSSPISQNAPWSPMISILYPLSLDESRHPDFGSLTGLQVQTLNLPRGPSLLVLCAPLQNGV